MRRLRRQAAQKVAFPAVPHSPNLFCTPTPVLLSRLVRPCLWSVPSPGSRVSASPPDGDLVSHTVLLAKAYALSQTFRAPAPLGNSFHHACSVPGLVLVNTGPACKEQSVSTQRLPGWGCCFSYCYLSRMPLRPTLSEAGAGAGLPKPGTSSLPGNRAGAPPRRQLN